MRKHLFLPCIPTRGTKVPHREYWIHEVKHDGFRLILQRDGNQFVLDGEALPGCWRGALMAFTLRPSSKARPELFRAACDMMLEGLVSKGRESRGYCPYSDPRVLVCD